jgi:2'-5' RNA ligase
VLKDPSRRTSREHVQAPHKIDPKEEDLPAPKGPLKTWELPCDECGPYSIHIVSSEDVRNRNLDMEEFGLAAIHEDFPSIVPEGEIWISAEIAIGEVPPIVAGALARLRALKNGASSDAAYERGLKKNKAERAKMKGVLEGGDSGDMDPREAKFAIIAEGRPEQQTVWIVEGTVVRDHFKADWLEGGNNAVYPKFTPKGEIWIEDDLLPHEMAVVALHEFTEWVAMTQFGFSYDKAHEIASTVEYGHRPDFGKEDLESLTAEWASQKIEEIIGKKKHSKEPVGEKDSKGMKEDGTDSQGGMIPTNLERAKKVDFITLPKGVPGTNCGVCKFVEERGKGHFCSHPEVRMPVNSKNCCALWDAKGTLRGWEQQHAGKRGEKHLQGESHDKGCLLLPIQGKLASLITSWTMENIPEFHLGEGGYSFSPHITVKYGYTEESEETVRTLRAILMRTGPLRIQFTGISQFPPGEDGVPLKLDVEGEQLHELNAAVTDGFEVEDKFPDYKPHVTLCYLRPDIAEYYNGDELWESFRNFLIEKQQ